MRADLHQRKIETVCKVDPNLKKPIVLLQLGRALEEAKQDLGDDYKALRQQLACLRHDHRKMQIVVDKDNRIIGFSKLKVCWIYHDLIPPLGWSICRQFTCLCPEGDETLLGNLFKTGVIRPSMRREQIDALRSLMTPAPIAPRH